VSWWQFRGRTEARFQELEDRLEAQDLLNEELRAGLCRCSPEETFQTPDEEPPRSPSDRGVGRASVEAVGGDTTAAPVENEEAVPVAETRVVARPGIGWRRAQASRQEQEAALIRARHRALREEHEQEVRRRNYNDWAGYRGMMEAGEDPWEDNVG